MGNNIGDKLYCCTSCAEQYEYEENLQLHKAATFHDIELPMGVNLPWFVEVQQNKGDPDEHWIYNPGEDDSPSFGKNMTL
jgi:hypothetical protein